jgi:hypothetical protein
MSVLGSFLVLVVLATACALVWQHSRYLHTRRQIVQDQQPQLYSGDAFHVVTFLQLAPGGDLFEEVRKLRDLLESGGAAQMVYAGKVAVRAMQSSQLAESFGEDVPWDAVTVVQYPSREAYDAVAASAGYQQALAGFAHSYSHGMKRGAVPNLMLPMLLLGKRFQQIVTRQPSHFPFVRKDEIEPRAGVLAAALLEERELGENAIAVVNFIKQGTPEQVAADRGYGNRMLGMMAEGGFGPMHMGRAVGLERGVEYDTVVIVYYPGVQFFADMARSEFFQGIVGGKQLGDTQATPTVPILGRL